MVGADSNNVQCVDCGFMRHRLPVDDETNIHEIVDSLKRQSPYFITDAPPWQPDFLKWVSPTTTDRPIFDITWGDSSNGTTINYKVRPDEFTITNDLRGYNHVTLSGSVV
jgi:hypothetical protein